MGAMENKSLNVFNTSCVLADPVTSSDANYFRVEAIIGESEKKHIFFLSNIISCISIEYF